MSTAIDEGAYDNPHRCTLCLSKWGKKHKKNGECPHDGALAMFSVQPFYKVGELTGLYFRAGLDANDMFDWLDDQWPGWTRATLVRNFSSGGES